MPLYKQHEKKKLKSHIIAKIRDGNLNVVDEYGNFINDIHQGDEEKVENRKRIHYHKFVKMANINIHKLPLTANEFYSFHIMLQDMNMNNVCDFTKVEEKLSQRSFERIRSALRKSGLIDLVRFGHVNKWYVNPFYTHRGKTVDPRLYDHFRGKLDYLTEVPSSA